MHTLDLALLGRGLVTSPSCTASYSRQRHHLTVAGDLAKWLEDKGMEHVRGAAITPKPGKDLSAGKQTLKNRIYSKTIPAGDRERQIEPSSSTYKPRSALSRESLNNLTRPTSLGRARKSLPSGNALKVQTIAKTAACQSPTSMYAALTLNPDEPGSSLPKRLTNILTIIMDRRASCSCMAAVCHGA